MDIKINVNRAYIDLLPYKITPITLIKLYQKKINKYYKKLK